MLKIYTCLSILLFAFNGIAQECKASLSGRVLDFHDNTVLEGATIRITTLSKTVVSDSTGVYRFESLCEGTYELEVFHPECSTLFVTVEIVGNTEQNITLEHHVEALEEVKVVGNGTTNKTNSGQEDAILQNTIEKYSAASLGDALKQLAGVSTLNTGATIVKPAIHGLNGSRVLILNDGVRLQDMEWGDEHAPNTDINAAGTITVIKGATALQYGGDAIGGIILMEQAHLPHKDTLLGKMLLGGLWNGRGGNAAGELTKVFQNDWFVKGQASYKRLGDQEAPDYILSNTGIQEIAGSILGGKRSFSSGWEARYSYYKADIAILRASHIGNVDDLISSINSGQPNIIRSFTYDLQNPRQEVRHHLGKLKFYQRFEGTGKWTVQYDYQNNRRFEFDVRRGERSNIPSIDLQLNTHTVSTDFKWDARDKLQLNFGLLGRYQENIANPETGVRRLIPDYEKIDAGAFVTGFSRLKDALTLDFGVRYDYTNIDALKFYLNSRWEERGYDALFGDLIVEQLSSQLLVNPKFDYHNWSAAIGLKYEPDNDSKLSVNLSRAQRAPNPSELFSDGLHHSAARIELGDLRILPETSYKIAATYDANYEHWGLSIEPYANWINDFILLEPSNVEFTIRGAFPVWEYRQTNARLLGVDIKAYGQWTKKIRSEHQFSIVKGKDSALDTPLINIPAASMRHSISYNRPDWNGFEFGLESNYVFRQNETPANITVFSPQQQQDLILEINTAPEAYHLLGLNAKMDFDLTDRNTLTTRLIASNLLNTRYRDYLNRQRYFADDLGTNITLQLKYTF